MTRGSFDQKSVDRNCVLSVDRNCVLSVDQNFHNQLTEFFDTFQLIKTFINVILSYFKISTTAKKELTDFGS